jgi:light-regulated signal transduction histidine kinase (bacteriophytochrome)
MHEVIEKIWQKLEHIQSINRTDREDLLQDLKRLDKELTRGDFKLKRTLKDKSIMANVLNATISDLEKSKREAEEANEELLKQKKLIEAQSQDLKDNLDRLELSYRELEQFSYIASHDLKSPLRTIASFAQLLKRRYSGKFDEEADEFLDFIVSGVFHMSDVIQGLLEYSKVGRESMPFENVDLNKVLDIVKFNLKEEIEESNAQLVYENLPAVQGNFTNLVQLFQNLIANSIKFRTPELSPTINITYIEEFPYFRIQLADNGLGMETEFQDKAFLPFQRLNNREKPGMGMGLAICKKIIQQHKGEIYYEPSPERGTSFILTLLAA